MKRRAKTVARPQNDKPSRPWSDARKLFVAGVGLALGAGGSTLFMLQLDRDQWGELVLWSGLLAVTLTWASSICLFTALARLIHRRRIVKPARVRLPADAEYVARYPRSDQVVAALLVVFFGLLTVRFLDYRRDAMPVIMFGAGMIFFILYAIHVWGTEIRFTPSGFVARRPMSPELLEPYSHVKRIKVRTGTLTVEFSGGQKIYFHRGLGDPDIVVELLQARCPASVRVD